MAVPNWPTTSYKGEKPSSYQGKCSCGDITVTMREPATDLSDVGDVLRQYFPVRNKETGEWQLILARCACDDCTRSQGSLLACALLAPVKTVEFSDPKNMAVSYHSSDGHVRKHCGNCGSQLGYFDEPIEKINLPLALFLRDDDDGKTNAQVASRLCAIPWSHTDKKSTLSLDGKRNGALAALVEDGVPKWDFSDGFQAPKDFQFSATAAPSSKPPERLSLSCHCKSLRWSIPYQEAQKGGNCCCLTCLKACGGLIWTTVDCKRTDVKWDAKGTFKQIGSRGFCTKCGSNVTWESSKYADATYNSLACVDDFSLYHTKAGSHGYIYEKDMKGLRLPTGHGEDGPDGGLSVLIRDGASHSQEEENF